MLIRQAELYYADLNPVKGTEQGGLRPVLVISGNTLNAYMDICIICPLTNKIKNFHGCLVLKKNKENKLKTDSEVLTFQIRTISKDRLVKKIGNITAKELHQIKVYLNEILTL